MRTGTLIPVVAMTVMVQTGCGGDENHAEGLKQPPTTGVPTAGPGSGKALAAHLHYTMQKNNPRTNFDDPSCPDVPDSRPGATVTCEMAVDGDHRRFSMRMDRSGRWQISTPD